MSANAVAATLIPHVTHFNCWRATTERARLNARMKSAALKANEAANSAISDSDKKYLKSTGGIGIMARNLTTRNKTSPRIRIAVGAYRHPATALLSHWPRATRRLRSG